MPMTKEEVAQLKDDQLVLELATRCGISTEDQLRALLISIHQDAEEALLRYQFAEMKDGELHLNESGLICSELILRIFDAKVM